MKYKSDMNEYPFFLTSWSPINKEKLSPQIQRIIHLNNVWIICSFRIILIIKDNLSEDKHTTFIQQQQSLCKIPSSNYLFHVFSTVRKEARKLL